MQASTMITVFAMATDTESARNLYQRRELGNKFELCRNGYGLRETIGTPGGHFWGIQPAEGDLPLGRGKTKATPGEHHKNADRG